MFDERKQAAPGSDAASGAGSDMPRCPWCSAVLPPETGDACPSCHATLSATGEPNIPGVTAIDIEKIALRRSGQPKKSRLMSWISGEVDDEGARGPSATPGSVAPPTLEVRQEMIRLELEVTLANLTAEAGALAAEEAMDASARGDAAAEPDAGATPATPAEPATAADHPAPPAGQA